MDSTGETNESSSESPIGRPSSSEKDDSHTRREEVEGGETALLPLPSEPSGSSTIRSDWVSAKSEPRELHLGSSMHEPGAYRVTPGIGPSENSSSSFRNEDEESAVPPPPDPARQPEAADDLHALDPAPVILEAEVVTNDPDPDSLEAPLSRNEAGKSLLVEARPETLDRRRLWLTLFGLLTLGIAVGISVGITQNRSQSQPNSGSSGNGTESSIQTTSPTSSPTAIAVMQQFLESLPEPTQTLIETDPSSPQARAFMWLSSPDHPRYENDPMERFTQRFALATLYYATQGDEWQNNNGWLNETVHECEWFGCTCSTMNDTVQSLIVDQNNLNGTLPTELGFLKGLDTFGLYVNYLHGSLPTEVGLLTRMEHLYVNDNEELTGPLPSELVKLTDLVTIVLHNCSFTGTIPTELGSLSNLGYLVLSNNALQSTIPTELGQLEFLDSLFLDNNQLEGPIPTELGLLPLVYSLYLGSNRLTGRIPEEIARLPAIYDLDLRNNSLTGPIPLEWAAVDMLANVYLDNNDLTGTIPSGLGNCPFLVTVDLHENQLGGTVPENLCELVSSGGLDIEIDCDRVACDCGCLCS